MWSLSSTDLAVYSVLAAVAGLPFLAPLLKGVKLPALPAMAAKPERWQAKSVDTLIALQTELEARKMPAAVKLCRELIWEVIGGDAK